MDLFDSHAHLQSPRFDADRSDTIARALCVGVTRILTCGSDLDTSRQGMALAAEHASVSASVGVHGHEASSACVQGCPTLDDAVWEQLTQCAAQPGVVAIGEIGLDYHYDLSPRSVQRAVLARQLVLARELDLPVIVHNRESDADLRSVVDAGPQGIRGVMHCFLADAAMADWALDRGLYIGVAGPITFKNVCHLPDIVRRVPLDRLLVETDCPYLAPHPLRGKRNEPAFVVHVAAKLAEMLGLSPESLARRTTENACRLFGMD